ncbi:zinc-binding alcohol dehydrogenase family protein [Actinoplanes philippinensis]|uniref:Zinc-type alcohol dehydrogenase-like protein n=1 Tax=Actinoplanes philippinensis TaxID=35752 RepID=A0A1I2HIN3_9ACTN|nr:zinc-binding alcohol dehydrogenase family protein [Actinoplanes philippinensis]SFF28747.1 zinc-binding alcohol dehydrogenase family protein [Actinoplanes philippinensis]
MTNTMKAVGYRKSLPVDHPESLLDLTLPVPEPRPHDLLVRVEAVSVNPVDVKLRAGRDPHGEPAVLGWDAAGVVERTGDAVTLFQPGDEVFYAGSINRPGTNAQFHLVDERLVGPKPSTLDFAAAAALPLTALTAWEALFNRLRLDDASTGTLLAVGAAGGVGSILVQLARRLTGLTVIGSASRPASRDWVAAQGAHRVVDHHDGFAGLDDAVDHIVSPHSAGMIETYARILRPFGAIVAIDEPDGLELLPLKSKSIAWHWEFMFTRALHDAASSAQYDILTEVARLVDKGVLKTTEARRLDGITAANLRTAHRIQESGGAIGKTVLAGF